MKRPIKRWRVTVYVGEGAGGEMRAANIDKLISITGAQTESELFRRMLDAVAKAHGLPTPDEMMGVRIAAGDG